jgi:hypothetical protein
LEEIWPQGIFVIGYYQNFINQFKDLLEVEHEILEFRWSYFDKSNNDKFEKLYAKRKISVNFLLNDAKRMQVISKKILEELEK